MNDETVPLYVTELAACRKKLKAAEAALDRLQAERDDARFEKAEENFRREMQKTRAEAAEASRDALAAKVEGLVKALTNLMAIVRGECPSLLDEDDGGVPPQIYCEDAIRAARAALGSGEVSDAR